MPFFHPRIPDLSPATDLSGLTILITGANAGLGYVTALNYLQLHASRLIFAVRSVSKGEQAKAALLSDPSIQSLPKKPEIDILQLDLTSHKSVLSFVGSLKKKYNHLDVALLNAGLANLGWEVCPETGNEVQLQVNYLSNVLLSVLLVPLLRASLTRKAHLTIVGSQSEGTRSSFPKNPPQEDRRILEWMNDKDASWSKIGRYNASKLFVSMFIRRLSRLVDESAKAKEGELVVNVTCPGMIAATSFDDDLPFPYGVIAKLLRLIRGRSLEDAARGTVYASYVAGNETKGEMVVENRVKPVTPFALKETGKKMEERLWKESIDFVEKEAPGALSEL